MSVQLTRVALGPGARPGKTTVFFRDIPIGTLQLGVCEQFDIDYVVEDIEISHNGPSEVFVSGYTSALLDNKKVRAVLKYIIRLRAVLLESTGVSLDEDAALACAPFSLHSSSSGRLLERTRHVDPFLAPCSLFWDARTPLSMGIFKECSSMSAGICLCSYGTIVGNTLGCSRHPLVCSLGDERSSK